MTFLAHSLVVFLSFATAAFLVGLFAEVGRYFIPNTAVRLVMAGNVALVAIIGAVNLLHTHRPPTWATWAIVVAFLVMLVGLGDFWHWYGTPAGRALTRRMLESVADDAGVSADAADAEGDGLPPAELSVRRLGRAVLAIFAILLLMVTVSGYFVVTNHAIIARNHGALCSFYRDLHDRWQGGEALLDAPGNRHQVVVAYGLHVPRAVIANQVHQQRRTLDSLAGLDC